MPRPNLNEEETITSWMTQVREHNPLQEEILLYVVNYAWVYGPINCPLKLFDIVPNSKLPFLWQRRNQITRKCLSKHRCNNNKNPRIFMDCVPYLRIEECYSLLDEIPSMLYVCCETLLTHSLLDEGSQIQVWSRKNNQGNDSSCKFSCIK